MKKIAIIGDIGSGKTHFAKLFKAPTFNADKEVGKIYRNNHYIFRRLKKKFPKFIKKYPINKNEILNIIFAKRNNLKIIGKFVHPIVRKKMSNFLKKNKKKPFVLLDVPLYVENNLNKKKDVIVYIEADKKKMIKNLNKRQGINHKLLDILRKNQMPLSKKKKIASFIINNDFNNTEAKKKVKFIKGKILQ